MSTTTALIAPRVQPRTLAQVMRPAVVPSVLHVDLGRDWGGCQNQLRLLMHELQELGVRQMCVCPAGSPLHDRLEEEQLPVRGATKVARLMRHYHIVHAHDAAGFAMVLIPAMLLRMPIAADRRVTKAVVALQWNRARRVIAISECVRDSLTDAGVDPRKVRLVHPGTSIPEVRTLPPKLPCLREELNVPAGRWVVGHIGRFAADRGQTTIVEAAAHAATRDVHWVLIGDGPYRGKLTAQISSATLEKSVHLAGVAADARRLLRELDMFVCASTGQGFCTSLLDAMAAGIPVVAADSAGPADLLAPVHAETGSNLYPPGDAVALARRVDNIRNDRALRQRIVAAQNRRLQEFTSESMALKTLDIYREILR